jgi:hypothetical protein
MMGQLDMVSYAEAGLGGFDGDIDYSSIDSLKTLSKRVCCSAFVEYTTAYK